MDAAIFIAILLAATFAVLVFDILRKQSTGGSPELMVEVDEAPGLAFLVIVGLLLYGYRRLRDQRWVACVLALGEDSRRRPSFSRA